MRVTSTVRYILRLSSLTKRPERSVWKGKEIDNTPSIEVCVHCHDDDSQSTDSEMAVNASELDLHHDGSSSSGSRSRLVRVVSWVSIVCNKCRWTTEQERELSIARSELARCQKAWSSEQELWLAYIEALTEEKEAHEEFLHHRAKQQDDEQQHFRKVWNRRRFSEEQQQQQQQVVDAHAHRANSRMRRLRKRSTDDF